MKIFLYLARRDKKGFRLLSMFTGPACATSRLTNHKSLNLPLEIENKILTEIKDNRMMWEPWVESAESFTHLREALKSRGYSNLPIHPGVAHINLDHFNVQHKIVLHGEKKKTMLRRSS